MPLIARASKTVRNKNLIIIAMCVGAMAWFAYDGWKAYPAHNDALIKEFYDSGKMDSTDQAFVREWKGWTNESLERREKMDAVVEKAKNEKLFAFDHYKTVPEINLQQYIVYGLGVATAAAIWWFLNCQRRRAIADDKTISPAPGIVVPWENITLVDNTRWDKVGIVELTFTDVAGKPGKANLDDYQTEREPLLEILDLLSEKAVNAKFIPEEPAAVPTPPAAPPSDKTT
jgi:hypothetical protein